MIRSQYNIKPGQLSHTRSTSAFAAVDSTDSLLRLYCEMVGLELLLKDRLPQWTGGHNIFTLLSGQFDTTVDSLATQLRQALSNLICTDRSGGASPVMLAKYPDLRYLHRSGDMTSGATDAQLDSIRDLLSDLYQQLDDAHGVAP